MMAKRLPYVREGQLCRPTGEVICGIGKKTGWFDWLGGRRSFRYEGAAGTHCTVVCEQRKGSSGRVFFYWYAHRRISGRLRRAYLGRAENLTLVNLEAAAMSLAQLFLFEDTGKSHNGGTG